MDEKKKSLGRGLEALLGASEPAQQTIKPDEAIHQLSIEKIGPGPFQPRRTIREEQLKELALSIEEQGIIQPIVVRERAVVDSQTGVRFEIIAGERRWRAAQLANLGAVPAVIRTMSDASAVAVALIENIQRENLNPLEEANAFQKLIIEYEMTHQEVANAVGRARASITNTLRLLDLSSSVQALLNEAKINMGHARTLLSLTDSSMQLEVANLIIEKKLSVRDTESLVRSILEGANKPKTKKQPEDPDIKRLESSLTQKLGAKVFIKHAKSGKGRLVIAYNSSDELQGILDRIR
ncbi:MAG TPA: ParB/RepB/Spo0J family partition protein [Gammaproteobacteria bacterium]|jgi:ParB family chromosome partitioning protein|nr:ParB/RepB/Spo0J family partition protein [Gammaproteobacteria bacterium]HJP42133.1 ParB/RepB/Spo0J family partition protein [Gammaproteobacteria bacterium]